MTESEWTRRICNGLKECGAVVFALVGSRMQAPGWPDRWVGHTVWSGWLEFKGLDTELRPLQAKIISDINARWPGGAYVVRQGITIEDAHGNVLATVRDRPASLLLALFELKLNVPERQTMVRQCAERLLRWQ